jgi:GR25 family glycosyltransferase involved in LPS biosynthesis
MNTNILNNYNVKLINVLNSNSLALNDKIKRIYVINMINDTIKRNYIILLMQKYNINFSLLIVDKVTDTKYKELCENKQITKEELGCCLSHLWCLNDIIENKYDNAIIFEDDIFFHKDFIKNFCKIYDTKKLDFLLLGAHDYHFSVNNYKNVINNVYYPEKTNKLYGAHANYYSLSAATLMYKIRSSKISFFDKEYSIMFEYFKKTSFVCFPNLVISDVSTSSLNHKKTFFSLEEEYYYKKCFNQNLNFSQYHIIYLNVIKKNMIPIKENDTYESYINRCLYVFFCNKNCAQQIKNRISSFFTIEDIKNIFNFNKNHNVITPNNLSKK